MRGSVVHYDPERAFGKIRARRRDFFVHRDHLHGALTLTPGQRVRFTPMESPHGPRATDVRVIEATGREFSDADATTLDQDAR